MERYPHSVRLIGVMHKEKSKMYVTSVLWSDQSDVVVYRTLRDFKKLHKQMKKAFPTASRGRKSNRIIPKFRVRRAKQGGQRKGPTKSLGRLKSLQKYCNELLNCDPRVTQSAELIQFFQPKDQDLQPEFSKNSIMIMPSDNDLKTGQADNVTQPFITETYRCVAPYETKDTKNKPFKVALDEKVDVLIKDKAGWWLVENDNKQMAWFPAPYLQRLSDDDDEDEDFTDETTGKGTLCTAIKNYKATKDDEISVNIGVVVEVLQKSDNGWWFIRYNGKAGYIPCMYLQPCNFPHVHMTANNQARRTSYQLTVPSSTLKQSQQLSLSQGNLLQAPPVRSYSPSPLQQNIKQRSHSLDILSERPLTQLLQSTTNTNVATTPATPKYVPPPTIMVEMDGEEEEQSRNERSESIDSFVSSDSDFSNFSDDLMSSSASSSLNLSYGANNEQIRLSRTPPPTISNHLSPTMGSEGKMTPSVSDPTLYRGPTTPKVPPRPQAQEILTRCSTITRKNAARGGASPTPNEILGR
ncbi:NADPH oxidase organizer 1a [Echeneis naucrates]|uniref:NADPH oxidase organizer 1a n=1 Tax=Echeneis naucrates TaxID=173247 RepID=A0A665WA96_ECHNA|nr:NADPH oxidase organizer 1 [Echeneis naucrates]